MVDRSGRLPTGIVCVTFQPHCRAMAVTVRSMFTLSKLSECHLAISDRLVAN
jgi:hypothetical protein